MNRRGSRRIIAGALAVLLVLGVSGCRQEGKTPAVAPEELDFAQQADLTAGVLHAESSGGWQDTLSHLEYSSLANVTAQDLETADDLTGCDMVIADPELLEEKNWEEIRRKLMDYVEGGGLLVLDNSFWDQFPAEFLGISGGTALDSMPAELTWPEVEENLSGVQEVIQDFAFLSPAIGMPRPWRERITAMASPLPPPRRLPPRENWPCIPSTMWGRGRSCSPTPCCLTVIRSTAPA